MEALGPNDEIGVGILFVPDFRCAKGLDKGVGSA